MNATGSSKEVKTIAIRRRGFLLVLSSPSGAGKTTITRHLLERDPTLSLSVSVTTRPRRPSEVDGRDYHFIDQVEFERMVAGDELLEHATVFGHSYGTPRAPIDAAIAAGHDIVTDIDWQGTQQIGGKAGGDIVTIFVLPPSRVALEARLVARGQDAPEIVAQRMAKSSEEMSHWPEYAYVILNDDLERAVADAQAIVTAERLRRERQIGLADFVTHLRGG
ncbi:MAG TPA: guanylate kinase [Stellaceae bacterium]|nr:guanylate kinase [Stellaceae bacterium]